MEEGVYCSATVTGRVARWGFGLFLTAPLIRREMAARQRIDSRRLMAGSARRSRKSRRLRRISPSRAQKVDRKPRTYRPTTAAQAKSLKESLLIKITSIYVKEREVSVERTGRRSNLWVVVLMDRMGICVGRGCTCVEGG